MQSCSGDFSQNISPLWPNIFVTMTLMPAPDRLKKCCNVNITIKSIYICISATASTELCKLGCFSAGGTWGSKWRGNCGNWGRYKNQI